MSTRNIVIFTTLAVVVLGNLMVYSTEIHQGSGYFIRQSIASGIGLGGIAASSLLSADGFANEKSTNPLAPKQPHFPGKAKNVIFLYMYGGPSHVDTFDYKPELQMRDGQSINIEMRRLDVKKETLANLEGYEGLIEAIATASIEKMNKAIAKSK